MVPPDLRKQAASLRQEGCRGAKVERYYSGALPDLCRLLLFVVLAGLPAVGSPVPAPPPCLASPDAAGSVVRGQVDRPCRRSSRESARTRRRFQRNTRYRCRPGARARDARDAHACFPCRRPDKGSAGRPQSPSRGDLRAGRARERARSPSPISRAMPSARPTRLC